MVPLSCNTVFKPTLRQPPYFNPCYICPWIGWINHKHTKNENKSHTKIEWIWKTYTVKTWQIPLFWIKYGITVSYFVKYSWWGGKGRSSHLILICEQWPFSLPLSKHQTAVRGDGKGRENKALVDVLRIQGDWSVTDGCFGLAAWPQQMLLWTLAHFPGLGCHLAYLGRLPFFTSLFETGQS